MEIKRTFDGQKGEFFIEREGKCIARMTFVMNGPSAMIIDHTEVSSSLKGQGVGKLLVAEGVKYAREQQVKIIPLCPFAKAEFAKNPEYADVLTG